MPPQKNLVIIVLGHKMSPFVKLIIDRDDIPVTWICSNMLDFQLYHPDPAKAATYRLEFTNLLETRAKNHIESLSIFETLGKFLEFYNPLKISTLNYLITKYMTSLNSSLKGLMGTWEETVKTIFDGNSMLPLFEEGRVLHIKVDGVEIPVRQYIIMKENEKKKENGAMITGIVDIEEIAKFKICDESIKAMERSQGVLIVPTDLLSLHLLARCYSFTEAVKKIDAKIAVLSPFWNDRTIPAVEREILEKTNIDASLYTLASKIKDFTDIMIIDEKDSIIIQKLQELGLAVLVDNLDPVVQASEQFLDRTLKSILFDLGINKRKQHPKIIALGEKIVSILSERFAKKEPGADVKPLGVPPLDVIPAAQVVAPGAVPAQVPAPAAQVIAQAVEPASALVPSDAKVEAIVPNLLKELDKVLNPKYEANIDGVLSALLTIIDKPRLLPSIYKVLVNKLEKLKKINPESRTIDIILYLAAHNPTAYTDLLSELLSDAMKQDDNDQFETLMHMASLIMGASQVKREEVLHNFLKEKLASDTDFAIERTRKILNYLVNKDPRFAAIIGKILVEFLTLELESPKPNNQAINNLVFFLLLIDAVLLGEIIVTDMPEAVHPKMKSLLGALSCGQSFNKIISNIMDAYQSGEYEALKKALNMKKVPASVQKAIFKRKYVTQLLKAGSVPLEMFAEKLGMTLPEAEKLIYEMILKGDISAKMEVVGGKLYIVKDEKKNSMNVKIN
ncbi:MAG: PCI domain-containing protein [Candidatus Sigynarchaeota archaeon]